MKWRKWILAAVLLAVPVWASAQVVANDGSSTRQQTSGMAVGGFVRADTTLKVLTMDASGNLKTVDADRDRDNWIVYSNAINDTIGTAGFVREIAGFLAIQFSAESTTVMPTYSYKRIALGMRVIPAQGDTATDMAFAVQVRGHSAASFDTSTTFVWHGWTVAPPVTQAGNDSLGHYDNVGYNATGFNSPFDGENLVLFSPKRGYGHLGYGQSFGGPTGILIPLTPGPRGESFFAPYMSVRIRMLRGKAGARVRLDVMMGS